MRSSSRWLPLKNGLFLVAILAFLSLGCRLPAFLQQSNSNEPSRTSGSDATPGPTDSSDVAAPTGNAREDVIRASKKFLELREFSATMDGEGKTPMHIELDYEQPDRFRMINNAGPAGQIETIIIGRDMYLKNGERWQKMPGALGQTVPQIRQLFDEKGLASLKDVTYIGEESIDGRDAYVYSYRNEASKDGSPYPFSSRIWVRQVDGLPGRIQVDYEGGDLKTLSIVYDYEKAVSIEPPVN